MMLVGKQVREQLHIFEAVRFYFFPKLKKVLRGHHASNHQVKIKVKVKLKCALEQAMNAQKGSRCIALLFLTRRYKAVSGQLNATTGIRLSPENQ